eukprot:Skav224910  [mRNA]  locus=scaffold1112:513402:515710:- [translate_table: standard]
MKAAALRSFPQAAMKEKLVSDRHIVSWSCAEQLDTEYGLLRSCLASGDLCMAPPGDMPEEERASIREKYFIEAQHGTARTSLAYH